MSNQEINISSGDELETWLDANAGDQLAEWSRVVAFRLALRVWPLVLSETLISEVGDVAELKQSIILQSWRAVFLASTPYLTLNQLVPARASAAANEAKSVAAAVAARSDPTTFFSARAAQAPYAAAAKACSNAAESLLEWRGFASYTARAAAAAASAYGAQGLIWRAVSLDCRFLFNSSQVIANIALLNTPLWLVDVRENKNYVANIPPWVREPLDTFARNAQGPEWKLMVEWYRRLIGDTSNNIFDADLSVELALQKDDFWEISDKQSADEIMGEVAKTLVWIPPPLKWDFFLSYTAANEAVARRISGVLEDAGYSVFSQFNDMGAGKSFVNEMNRGLAGMGRMIAVYSPEYFKSGPCMSEWEAAYTIDPSGDKGTIVPFLIEPCQPPPLARRIIWTSLLEMTPEQEREAVLAAVTGSQTPKTRAEQRKRVAIAVTPEVLANEDTGEIDVGPNKEFDQVYADVPLLELPEAIRALLDTLLSQIQGRNYPSGFDVAIKAYKKELDANGVNCNPTLLRTQMDIIEAELEDEHAQYWCTGAGLVKSCERLLQLHERLITHYPLDQARERIFRAVEVDEEKLTSQDATEFNRRIIVEVKYANEQGVVSDEYLETVKTQSRTTRNIIDLSLPEVPEGLEETERRKAEDRRNRIRDAKKRTLLQQAGVYDKTLDVLGKMTKIADSDAAKTLGKAAKDFLEWFW
ncbi:MAG: TIR domain-containing protein [Pseudomonadota bacterium]